MWQLDTETMNEKSPCICLYRSGGSGGLPEQDKTVAIQGRWIVYWKWTSTILEK